jgi:hypothetical protein
MFASSTDQDVAPRRPAPCATFVVLSPRGRTANGAMLLLPLTVGLR